MTVSKKHGIALLVLALIIGASYLYLSSPHDRPVFGHSSLTITRQDGKAFVFDMEVATNTEQEMYGLMYIKSLSDDRGMIFPYSPPQPVAFWMKNTYISLDMLFVNKDGKIARIEANAKPLDVSPVFSGGDVIAVVEVKGGVAQKNGFTVGDKVSSPAFKGN